MFKPTSVPCPIAPIKLRMKSTRKVFLHYADASTTQQQTVGLLTRKQQEHAYDALRAIFVFFLQVFFIQHNQKFCCFCARFLWYTLQSRCLK